MNWLGIRFCVSESKLGVSFTVKMPLSELVSRYQKQAFIASVILKPSVKSVDKTPLIIYLLI